MKTNINLRHFSRSSGLGRANVYERRGYGIQRCDQQKAGGKILLNDNRKI